MKLKLLLFGILLVLFSIPLMLFLTLSFFNCGFVEGRMCCYIEGSICCIGSEYMGCISLRKSNMGELCRDYCFEMSLRIGAGFSLDQVHTLQYCRNNCTEFFPCPITLQNGTTFERIC